jgi:hypothetical protein
MLLRNCLQARPGGTTPIVACGTSCLAPKGQKSLAQGLPWVNFPLGISPEGAVSYGENRPRTSQPDRDSSPFRAQRLFWLTQGKPG